MTKKIILPLLFAMTLHCAFAQEYVVAGTTPHLHLTHIVAAKETWFSIGRTFNLPPNDIAAYNKLNIKTPLEIGQQVEVPLNDANFFQNDARAADETFIPVYHIVQPKEWLYRISVNYNKVPVESLQKWNNIGKDGAKAGTNLIVGYLKVKDANATLAPKAAQPVEKAVMAKDNMPVKKEPTPDGKTTQSKATPDGKPAETKPADSGLGSSTAHKDGSYFKNFFEDTGKSSSGIAGIFKSTSGWSDRKYYALASNIPVGTIVKITLPSTSKSIYAKVLGELPDMKESAGLALRISDAAAYELGSPDSKFSVGVKY